ncbi:hypothetical protein DRQ00_09080 [candidate division KSB1 bacterium]|nr:MAG: hypothetical protein DRQ00_09080 [candidate division KSB1 bacterium]
MSIVVPNVGEVLLLKYMLNHTPATNVVMRLFTSNIEPDESDVLGTYSGTEPSDVAYTPATLTGSFWTVATVGGVSSATYSEQHFSFSTTNSTYGYYVTDNTNSELLWAERFDAAPFNIPSGGGNIAITPKIELA